MERPYTFKGASVLEEGREVFTYAEVAAFAQRAVSRRQRRGAVGYRATSSFDKFLSEVALNGKASYTWNFLSWTGEYPYYRATLTIEQKNPAADEFTISLSSESGEDPWYVLQRVAELIHQENVRFAPKARSTRSRKNKQRRAKKRRARKPRDARIQQQTETPKQERRPRKVSTRGKENLSAQFQKQYVLWNEAVKAVAAIFEIKSDGFSSGQRIAERRLLASLEHSEGQFATYRKHGFTLQFELKDGRWRGDITPCAVWATKKRWRSDERGRRVYRRMRAYFRKLLVYPDPGTREARKTGLETALSLPLGFVVIGGIRYGKAVA